MKATDPPQRLGPVVGLPALLSGYNVDSKKLFAEFGLDVTELTSETRAPFSVAVALLERAAEVSGCPHLGLELGARLDHRIMGPVGMVMECAPNLESALRDYIRYQMAHSKAAAVYLCKLGEDFALGYGVYYRGRAAGRQLYDLTIALGCNYLRSLTKDAVEPTEIHLTAAQPKDVTPYRRILSAPVIFDQGHTCLVIKASDLQAKLPSSNPPERVRLKASLDAALQADLKDTPARVRHLMRPRLLSGRCGIDSIAEEMAVHPRTLSRHLARHELTFEGLRDEVRYAVSRELLELTNLPIGSIGDALSYSSYSAFVHAFRRWSGVSPSDWRRSQKPSA